VLIAGCAIATAIVLANLIAGVITDPSTRSLRHWAGSLTVLVALWTVRTGAQWLQARLGQRGASAVIADLSGQVLRAVTALAPRELAGRRDTAATLVTRGLDGLRPYFTTYLPALFLAAILTPATVAVIACYDLTSAAIVLVALPLIPIFMILIGLATAERSTTALAAMTTLQARLLDLIAGIPTLRALGRADGPAQRIDELSAAHRRSAMATLVLELLATLGVALVAVSVGLRLVSGEMSLATGLTVLLLAPDVFWPLRRVGVEFHAAQDGKTAADTAFGLIDQCADAPSGTATVVAAGAVIDVEDVSTTGRDGRSPCRLSTVIRPGRVTVLTGDNGAGKSTTLQAVAGLTVASSGRYPGSTGGAPVTVDLEPGARLAVTGRSGSGKTTLLMTLAGLLPPLHGEVMVDATPLSARDESEIRGIVCYFAEDAHLFATTIRDNLLVARGDCPDAELADALKRVGLGPWLEALPEGLATVLAGGAAALSAGQRRRLLLARVLISPAPIVLLDEPTEHLDAGDADDANDMLRALLDPRGGLLPADRTAVVATHHLAGDIRCPRLCTDTDGYPDCRSSIPA
jgi:ATP-binding cassette subfamily C protein CydD